MKIKVFPAFVALALSSLFAYGLYSWGNNANLKVLISILGGVSLFLTMGTILGISLQNKRKSANIKTVSAVFAVIVLIAYILFSCFVGSSTTLIVFVGCLIVLLWALFVYLISIAKKG